MADRAGFPALGNTSITIAIGVCERMWPDYCAEKSADPITGTATAAVLVIRHAGEIPAESGSRGGDAMWARILLSDPKVLLHPGLSLEGNQ